MAHYTCGREWDFQHVNRKNKSFCREANTSTTCVYSILITVQARLRTRRPPHCQVREATQTLRWPLDCTSTFPPYWSGLLAKDWTWKMPELCNVNFLMISEIMSPLILYCRLSSFYDLTYDITSYVTSSHMMSPLTWPHTWCHQLAKREFIDRP